MKKYIIFGVSPFLSDIIDIIHANGGRVAKIFLNMPEVQRERTMSFRDRLALLDYKVEVHEDLSAFKPQKGFLYSLGTPTPHKKTLVEELKAKHSLTFAPLIHPTVHVGSNVKIGEGVILNVNTTIGPNAQLDDFCVVNRCVSIGHEAHIGCHALIGPQASIAGAVQVGEGATIAMRATVIDKSQIGAWAVVGAASLVTKDVPANMVVYGSPAKVIRENPDANIDQYKKNRALS